MKPEPFSFSHPVGDFDLTKLPVDPTLLQANPGMLASAVQTYYEESFRKLGGSAAIAIKDGVVSVAWYPKAGDAAEQVFEHAVSLLRQGDYQSAEPLLRALLARDPDNTDVLLNLGMMLSDQRKLAEATTLLRRFVNLAPQISNGWTALGVAESRNRDVQSATVSLQRALEIDPENAYALRNLASLVVKDSPQEALPIFAKAARLMPDDQGAQYGYAQCLLLLEKTAEASALFERVIQLGPLNQIAELARTARTEMAQSTMRSAVGGGLRPDVVLYCLDGLKKFRDLGKEQTLAIVYEISMLGRSGLNINDPKEKHSLHSIPGKFSGLYLVSLMYTGLKQINPTADAGIDLSKEYAEAKRLFEKD